MMNRFMQLALELAKPEMTVGELNTIERRLRSCYNTAMLEAAHLADSYGGQCCGGSGAGGEGYHNLASAIRAKQDI